MNKQAPNPLIIMIALVSLWLAMGCDQRFDEEINGFDEIEWAAESDVLDDRAVGEADDVVGVDGPRTSEIRILYSSREDQLRDEVAAKGRAPDIEDFGHVLGMGPEDIPAFADELTDTSSTTMESSLVYDGAYSFGGSSWPRSYDIIRGPSRCGSDRTRFYATAYVDQGFGSCYVSGWYTSNPTDCRIRVRVNEPGWYATGTCRMYIYAQ